MHYASIEELLESEYANTIRLRNSVGRFNVIGLSVCAIIYMLFIIVFYSVGYLDFVSFALFSTAFFFCMPIGWIINRYRPDKWYMMRTRRVTSHMNADEHDLYLEHIQNLKSIRERHKKNKIGRRRIGFLP